MPFPTSPSSNEFEFRQTLESLSQRVSPPLPQARVYNNAAITLTNATVTTLTFNSERFDSGGLHSISVNPGRLTAPITGLYTFGGHVGFASNASGERYVELRVNGSTIVASDRRAAATVSEVSIVSTWRLAAGDYVELRAYQSSGGDLNVASFTANSPEFWMTRLGGYVNMGVS